MKIFSKEYKIKKKNNLQMRKWRTENRDKYNKYQRDYRKKKKTEQEKTDRFMHLQPKIKGNHHMGGIRTTGNLGLSECHSKGNQNISNCTSEKDQFIIRCKAKGIQFLRECEAGSHQDLRWCKAEGTQDMRFCHTDQERFIEGMTCGDKETNEAFQRIVSKYALQGKNILWRDLVKLATEGLNNNESKNID